MNGNRFKSTPRRAVIRGVEILAVPMPWRCVKLVMQSEVADDNAARIEALAEGVEACCTYADGAPVKCADLPCDVIAEIFKFAADPEAAMPNFTRPPSEGSPGEKTEKTA